MYYDPATFSKGDIKNAVLRAAEKIRRKQVTKGSSKRKLQDA